MKNILIIGGGFGGIRAALDLDRARFADARVTLLTNRPHFEYHPALYRLVTGRSPLEVCIPLSDIFAETNVAVVIDTVNNIELGRRRAKGLSGSVYSYDYLVLALGSENAYFNIPGLKELSFGFKSIPEALRLKSYLHELFEKTHLVRDESEKIKAAHLIVVGGGASGVELAGELGGYIQNLAETHNFDPGLLTIDLLETAPRLLPNLPEGFANVLENRLRQLGVNIFLNRAVLREDVERVYVRDMQLATKTVIWTAGTQPNNLYTQIPGLKFDSTNRVQVGAHLEVPDFPEVFVIGDAASTPYAGMAQTAIHNARYVAGVLAARLQGKRKKVEKYVPKQPYYAIPVGPGWAGVIMGEWRFYGYLGWVLRRAADLRFFLSILPWRKAILAFRNEKTLCETCLICSPEEAKLSFGLEKNGGEKI